MKQKFNLKIYDSTKGGWGSVLGIIFLLVVAFVGLSFIQNATLALLWAVVVLGVGGYWGYLRLKRWAFYEAVACIENGQLLVQRLDTEKVTTISFADVASYRYTSFNNATELRFKMLSGAKEVIKANNFFGEIGDFIGLDVAIEQVSAQLHHQNPLVMTREKSFFEKPVSTYFLVIITIIVGVLIWSIAHSNRPIRGNLFTGLGGYISYLAAWLAAAERRKQG